MTHGIMPAADSRIAEFERMTLPTATRAGQLRVLDQIRHIAIRDMVARLTPSDP